MPNKSYYTCSLKLSKEHCPDSPARLAANPQLRLFVKTLPRSEYFPDEYHYTNFHVKYKFYFCDEEDIAPKGRLSESPSVQRAEGTLGFP